MLRLEQRGVGIKRIAAEPGCSKNKVKRYLRAGGWLADRKPGGSAGSLISRPRCH